MIQRFDQLGGLKALFDAFYWALSLLDTANTTTTSSEDATQQQKIIIDRDRLQEGTDTLEIHRGMARSRAEARQHHEYARETIRSSSAVCLSPVAG